MIDIKELARKRLEAGEKKYGEIWKKKTKLELIVDVDEEIADLINYLQFYSQLYGRDVSRLIENIVMLHKDISRTLTPVENMKPLNSFEGVKLE